MRRGEIWWASLRAPSGSEPGFRRPVLIVQADEFTESRIRSVVGVVITSKLALASAPGNILLKKRQSKLPKDSVINVSQVITINKSFLTERVCRLPVNLVAAVDEGLRLALAL